jgi:Uma2 family endonuclease
VIPDVVWISRERLLALQDEAGHLRGAPELVVEVLSPGAANERRDREVKLALYARRGVDEYWIVNWRMRTVQVYRRDGAALRPVATLQGQDTLTSPLLPGFSCPVSRLWPPF